MNQADRVCAVAAAAAVDLNDELTIILNSAAYSIEFIEPDHPARPLLLDIQRATERCVWKTSGLNQFSARRGLRPIAVPMERLMLEVD